MRLRSWALVAVMAVAMTTSVAVQKHERQEKGGEDETGEYDVVENWFKGLPNHEGWIVANFYAALADTPNRILVATSGEVSVPPKTSGAQPAAGRGAAAFTPQRRKEHLLFAVDGNGKVVEEFPQWDSLFGGAPHSMEISPYDPEKHVWVVDANAHQVFKFTHDMKTLVTTMGEKGVGKDDETHFDRPTDLAFLPDGTFFVADGYNNARVIKFDKNGKFLMSFGTHGTGPSQFDLVHCIAIDAKRRLYVIDRRNHRIQIFDENGKFLDLWPNIRTPAHLLITKDQFLWTADGSTNRFLKYDLNGKLLTYWGVSDQGNTNGPFASGLADPHKWSVDTQGNLYVASFHATPLIPSTLKKFVPKPDADMSRIVGQPFVFDVKSVK